MKLRSELEELLPQSEKDSMPQFQTVQKFPFLDACVKEAFRIHPAARFSADRVLPSGGATIAGHNIPGGTVVGISAWAMHRREDIFGQDVESYNPWRWLPNPGEIEDQAKARIAEMNRHMFQFGSGKFNCIGQNVSRMEMYKATAALLWKFDFELADPEKEWTLMPGSFVNVTGVDVFVRRRVNQ
jgi:cytochrome P450